MHTLIHGSIFSVLWMALIYGTGVNILQLLMEILHINITQYNSIHYINTDHTAAYSIGGPQATSSPEATSKWLSIHKSNT